MPRLLLSSDYRGLKKLITAIKKARENGEDFVPLQGVTDSPRPSMDASRSDVSLDRHAERDGAGQYGSMGTREPSSSRRGRDQDLSISTVVERLENEALKKDGGAEVRCTSSMSEASSVKLSQDPQNLVARPRAFRSKTDVRMAKTLHWD